MFAFLIKVKNMFCTDKKIAVIIDPINFWILNAYMCTKTFDLIGFNYEN